MKLHNLSNIVVIACLAPPFDAIDTILSLLNPLYINVSYFSNIVVIACLAPPFDAIDTILSLLNPFVMYCVCLKMFYDHQGLITSLGKKILDTFDNNVLNFNDCNCYTLGGKLIQILLANKDKLNISSIYNTNIKPDSTSYSCISIVHGNGKRTMIRSVMIYLYSKK